MSARAAEVCLDLWCIEVAGKIAVLDLQIPLLPRPYSPLVSRTSHTFFLQPACEALNHERSALKMHTNSQPTNDEHKDCPTYTGFVLCLCSQSQQQHARAANG